MEITKGEHGNVEIIDTCSDLIRAEIDFRNAFPNQKFNLMLFLSAGLKQYPHLEEVFKDFDTFSDELADLSPAEASDAVLQITANVGQESVLRSRLYRVFRFAGSAYVGVYETIRDAEALLQKSKARGEDLWGQLKYIGAKT